MAAESEMNRDGQERSQILVEVSPNLRRRIDDAAARHEQSASEYVEAVLERAVPDVHPPSLIGAPLPADAADRVDALRERIMRGRVLHESSVDVLRDLREERIAEA